MVDVILKRFEKPDEIREMQKGRFEIVHIGGLTIGPQLTSRAGAGRSTPARVSERHCAMLSTLGSLSGTATAAFEDGRVIELRAGELFHIPAEPHDSWVAGDVPYVSLHFLGADHYAK